MRMKVELYMFLSQGLILNGSNWSASNSGRLTFGEIVPLIYYTGSRPAHGDEAKKSLSGNEIRLSSPQPACFLAELSLLVHKPGPTLCHEVRLSSHQIVSFVVSTVQIPQGGRQGCAVIPEHVPH
jgi:hypothetical protein